MVPRRPYARLVATAALIAVTALAYLPLRSAGFVYEDENWARRPVVWSVPSSALAIWTLQHATPGVSHVIDVGLHLGNGLLVSEIGTLLVSPEAGVAAAAIFLLHPLNSEAVSYLKARSDVLVTGLLLLGLLLQLQPTRRRWHGVATCALAALAPWCDPVGLLFVPLVIGARWLLRPPSGATYEPAVPAPVGLIAIIAVVASLPILVTEFVSGGGSAIPWPMFLERQAAAVCGVFWLLVDPRWLSIDHDVMRYSPLFVQVSLAVVSAALLTAGYFAWRRRHPVIAWCVAWPLVVLAPHFIFRTNEWVSEHQVYPAMPAICVGLAAGVCWLGLQIDAAVSRVHRFLRLLLHIDTQESCA